MSSLGNISQATSPFISVLAHHWKDSGTCVWSFWPLAPVSAATHGVTMREDHVLVDALDGGWNGKAHVVS